jgi:hypothetical protein
MSGPFTSRVYLKPLLPSEGFQGDTETILKHAKKDLLKRIRAKLTQTTFSKRAKLALSKALKIEIKPSSLIVTAKHPAFAPLVMGQRKQQMKWLTKATRPIPIITEEGKLIFRNATAKSMKNGSWHHPGRAPSDFVERAKKESRTFLKAKLDKELKKQIRAAWTR